MLARAWWHDGAWIHCGSIVMAYMETKDLRRSLILDLPDTRTTGIVPHSTANTGDLRTG